ncbi:MAG: 4'-phosphopantetheinyl transferase superfamily protein [Bacteroidales bacterium]|nr:4'-phosphopantetheinyl transferase superfamily protein [Bacteroidales bacterium]
MKIKEITDSCISTENNSEEDISIYIGETPRLTEKLSECFNLLNQEEQEQALRFYHQEDKNTYILVHGLLRKILSERTNIEPNKLAFQKNQNQKPELVDKSLHFNISHCKNALAIAIFEKDIIGIDIEHNERITEWEDISNHYFSDNELKWINENKVYDRNTLHYIIWTRKEAFLKGAGVGLINDLKGVDVSNELLSYKSTPYINEIKTNFRIETVIYRNNIVSFAIPEKNHLNYSITIF